MMALALIPLMALANRVRGGLFGARIARARPLYVIALGLAIALGAYMGWRHGLGWGLAYLAWGAPAWGRWYDLGRLPDDAYRDGPPAKWTYQWAIGLLPNDHWRLFTRHLFIAPALCLPALLAGPVWLPLAGIVAAALIVGCYEIGWRLYERNLVREPTNLAEWLAGAVWGALILLVGGST